MFNLSSVLVESILFGFGLFMVISNPLLWFRGNRQNTLLLRLISSAVLLARVAGLLFLFYWIFQLVVNNNNLYSTINEQESAQWWWFWVVVLPLPLLTQLFWLKNVRNRSGLRFLLGLAILFFSLIFSEYFILAIASFHRDYVGVDETLKRLAIPVLKNIFFFGIVLTLMYLFQNKQLTQKQKDDY